MLDDDDMVWLVQQLVATSELLGLEIKPNAAALLAEDLAIYPRNVLAKAMQRVRTEHTGRLTPKAILDRIDEVMGRPGANEAWAQAVQALDERNTVVWTSEMSDAWLLARDVAAEGDMVGARMSFISAYERLVRTARDERRMPEVTVSIGWDGQLRAVALEKAVQMGYLSPAQAAEHRPALEHTPGFQPLALLAGKVEAFADPSPQVREKLAKLREDLKGAPERRRLAREEQLRAEEARLQSRKADTQRLVDAFLGGAHA